MNSYKFDYLSKELEDTTPLIKLLISKESDNINDAKIKITGGLIFS